MNALTINLNDLFKQKKDKTQLTIYPNITSLIIDEITLIIELTVTTEQGFTLNEKLSIKIYGNLGYFNLIKPEKVSIYTFDGY